MSVDALKASKLGKIIVKLVKDPPAPGMHDLSNLTFWLCIHTVKYVNLIRHCKHAYYRITFTPNDHTYLTMFRSFALDCSNQGYGVEFRTEVASIGRGRHQTNGKQ